MKTCNAPGYVTADDGERLEVARCELTLPHSGPHTRHDADGCIWEWPGRTPDEQANGVQYDATHAGPHTRHDANGDAASGAPGGPVAVTLLLDTYDAVTLLLDTYDAEYLLERLGGPPFIDSLSSDRERADAVSYDCIVGQLERGLAASDRKAAGLLRWGPQ